MWINAPLRCVWKTHTRKVHKRTKIGLGQYYAFWHSLRTAKRWIRCLHWSNIKLVIKTTAKYRLLWFCQQTAGPHHDFFLFLSFFLSFSWFQISQMFAIMLANQPLAQVTDYWRNKTRRCLSFLEDYCTSPFLEDYSIFYGVIFSPCAYAHW